MVSTIARVHVSSTYLASSLPRQATNAAVLALVSTHPVGSPIWVQTFRKRPAEATD